MRLLILRSLVAAVTIYASIRIAMSMNVAFLTKAVDPKKFGAWYENTLS